MINKTFGHYQVVEKLGEGGMGAVFKAIDTHLDREVALKVLSEQVAGDDHRRERFEREARLLAHLNHPQIATIHGFEVHQGTPFLVMELVSGEDLKTRLLRGPVPLEEALAIARQVSEALEHAHEHGVIHRDLKPANIMVDEDLKVKVLDFGLAKALQANPESYDPDSSPTVSALHETAAGTIMGTAGYLSPEQARGRKLDQRTDIWSFGCVLFELLTGQQVYQGDTVSDIIVGILRNEPEWNLLPGTTPPAVRRLLRRCLAKDRRQRLSSIADARLELDDAIREPEPAEEKMQVKKIGWVRQAAPVAAALLVAGAFLLTFWPRPAPPVTYQRLTYERGTVFSARLSPDGQTMVYSAAWEGSPVELYLQPLKDAQPIAIKPSGSRILSISNRGELAILLAASDQRGTSESFDGSPLAVIPMTGGTPRVLEDMVAGADWEPAGDALVIVRILNGRSQLEYPRGNVIYSSTGWIRCPRFSPDGRLIACFLHPVRFNDRGVVAIVDLDGNHSILTDELENLNTLAWSPDASEILFAARAGAGSDAIYAVSPDKSIRKLASYPGDVELLDVNSSGTAILNLRNFKIEMVGCSAAESPEVNLTWHGFSAATDISADGLDILFMEQNRPDEYEICLRRLDGSPPLRLGLGMVFALTTRGDRILGTTMNDPTRLRIIPTGSGATREYELGRRIVWADWCSDDEQAVIAAIDEDDSIRLFLFPFAEPELKPLSKEIIKAGFFYRVAVTPGGDQVAATGADGIVRLFPLDGSPSQILDGTQPEDVVLTWSRATGEDFLFVMKGERAPRAEIYQVFPRTGRRELWRVITPLDPVGVRIVLPPALASETSGYAYSYPRLEDTLYIAQGFK